MAGNPFSKQDTHSKNSILAYRIASILSWLLLVVATFYYTYHVPKDDKLGYRHTIWGVNNFFGHSPFALNSVIASIYWLALFAAQLGYVWSLFSKDEAQVNAAGNVGTHFIANNMLQFAWVMLWVRSHFIWSEAMLVINFFNLTSLYFRHSATPRLIHIGAVAGPLAWTFVALYWNGAIAFNAHSLPSRLVANIAIWGILVYGMFFLIAYKDWAMGFALSILSASLGVGQFFTKAVAFQWIFAFVIMAVLFIATVLIAVPGIFGKDHSFRRETEGEVVGRDQERAPLLNDR